jgi:bifunctional non-homologous end joining protein LigD
MDQHAETYGESPRNACSGQWFIQPVRLISRNGRDLTYRFPLVASAIAGLPAASCPIDGEAIVCDDKGLSVFDLIRNYRHGNAATLCAFDLLELDYKDLRDWPIE